MRADNNKKRWVLYALTGVLFLCNVVFLVYSRNRHEYIPDLVFKEQLNFKEYKPDENMIIEKVISSQEGKIVTATLEGDGFGSGSKKNSVEVYFGRRYKGIIISHTPKMIKCYVPPSEYAGIGYDTNVKITVNIYKDKQWRSATFSNSTDEWWTYPATIPPTRVANIAAALFFKENDNALLKVTKMFAKKLGRDWRFQFFVYKGVSDYYMKDPFVHEEYENGRLEVTFRDRLDYMQFARIQLNYTYWEPYHGDRILSYQSDSVPCNNSLRRIEYFYGVDYIGAPWCHKAVRSGNSGLSLRNKTTTITILKNHTEDILKILSDRKFKEEDVALCTFGMNDGYNVSSKALGVQFSVEMTYGPRPWGVHKAWRFIKKPLYQQLLQDCPELQEMGYGMNVHIGRGGVVCQPDPFNIPPANSSSSSSSSNSSSSLSYSSSSSSQNSSSS